MAHSAIVGINWGDEGKGRMVDLLTEDYDVVVRYQGGGNAGHTVVNEQGTFALHLLPSGIFRPDVINILGNGVAVDCENLWKEMQEVEKKGVKLLPPHFQISERASLVLPWHRELDALEEARLADQKFGSTKQGIAPFYADKAAKKTILAGELLHPAYLRAHVEQLVEWKNLTLTKVYGAKPTTTEEVLAWLDQYGTPLKPYIGNTAKVLREADRAGKRILFEAQLGALRDLDLGIHPYTTSSNALAAYAPVGSGYPGVKLDNVIGVVKAYSSCVGEGPFTCEWFGEEAEALRKAGNEYGAKTGRPRRVGPIDLVATRYGVQAQGATTLALTKLDVLSYLSEIPVVVRYTVDGEETDEFPFPACLEEAKPVEITLPGWKQDISSCRTWDALPKEAKDYVLYLEQALDCPIHYVSVGPERDAIILR
ncbi:adenylosuccinate synthase [Murdochiella massiliensis]|uniref:adenylosuccinate synthase n=1 Tax=Murdochiella massiliensis TaxID=1673723 RepID=UPI00082D94FE|nr:adenylosuccinate synthase [Murdochiella massiliensis]